LSGFLTFGLQGYNAVSVKDKHENGT